jgi:hypothetical protein
VANSPLVQRTGLERAGIFGPISGAELLIAMQKVVGSNPISRSRKGLRLQVFFVHEVA